MRSNMALAAVLAVLLGAFLPAVAQEAPAGTQQCKSTDDPERIKVIKKGPPSATLNFEATQLRLLLGGGGGKGVLHYQSKDYPFTGKGASAGGIGYAEVEGTGEVFFLNKLEDFAGTYGAATAGAALVEGVSTASYQNQKCVVMILSSKSKGAGLFMGVAAISIELATAK